MQPADLLADWLAMTVKPAFSRETDLTGVWSGEYWYAEGGRPTPFTAHLIETSGALAGTTLEPATFGLRAGELSATLDGARGDASVRFTKVYDASSGVHQEPIFYSGTVDAQLTMIEGEWTFRKPGHLRGRFVLVRVSRGVKAAEREVAEEVSLRD